MIHGWNTAWSRNGCISQLYTWSFGGCLHHGWITGCQGSRDYAMAASDFTFKGNRELPAYLWHLEMEIVVKEQNLHIGLFLNDSPSSERKIAPAFFLTS